MGPGLLRGLDKMGAWTGMEDRCKFLSTEVPGLLMKTLEAGWHEQAELKWLYFIPMCLHLRMGESYLHKQKQIIK